MSVIETTSRIFKNVKGVPRKLFGTRNDRLLKAYRKLAGPINGLESEIRGDFDQRFAKRVAKDQVHESPEEGREGLLRNIRLEPR